MPKNEKSTTICKSVFKSGKITTTEQDFTKTWIDLINTLEKDKHVNFCEKAWQ